MEETLNPQPAEAEAPVEESGQLRKAYDYLLSKKAKVHATYEDFESDMQGDERLSQLHDYFKKNGVKVDSDFKSFKSRMLGTPVAPKKDAGAATTKPGQFGNASQIPAESSSKSGAADKLLERIVYGNVGPIRKSKSGELSRTDAFGAQLYANGRVLAPDKKTMGNWTVDASGKVQYHFPDKKVEEPVRKKSPIKQIESDATRTMSQKPVMRNRPVARTGEEGFLAGVDMGVNDYNKGNLYAETLLQSTKENRLKFAEDDFQRSVARSQELARRGEQDQEPDLLSWTGIGQMVGSMIKPIAETVTANMASPVAGTVVAVAGGAYSGAGGAYQRAYQAARSQGMSAEQADAAALKMAGVGAAAGAIENLVGVKAGPVLEKATTLGTKVFGRMGGQLTGILAEAGVDAGTAAGLQFGQNVAQNSMGIQTDLSEGVADAAAGEALFSGVSSMGTAAKFIALNVPGKKARAEATEQVQVQVLDQLNAAIPDDHQAPIGPLRIMTHAQARQQAEDLAAQTGIELTSSTAPTGDDNPIFIEPNRAAWRLMYFDDEVTDGQSLQEAYQWMVDSANKVSEDSNMDPAKKALYLSEVAEGMQRAEEILDRMLAEKKPSVEEQVQDMRDGEVEIGKVRKDAYGDPMPPAKTQKPAGPIAPVPGEKVMYNGEQAEVKIDGQTVVVETEGRIYEIGNVDEVKDLSQHGVEAMPEPEEIPAPSATNIVNPDYSVTLNGNKYVNRYSDKQSAVERDADGNVVSVTLDTEDGKKRTFRGENAETIAYEYGLLANKKVEPKKPVNEPNAHIGEVAKKYNKDAEVDDTLVEKLDIDNSKAIADAFAAMKHEPENPEVKRAYEAMAKETKDQWDALVAEGYTFEPWEGEGQPYETSADMARDLKDNKHLYFFQTEKGYGSTNEDVANHPLLQQSGVVVNGKDLVYNDLFRAVHDAFGHGKLGNQFGPLGEENAWRTHAQMYSPEARRAATTETRGQNSWVNFGPHMRNADGSIKKKGDEGYLDVHSRPYADQKVGLLPEEFSQIVPSKKVEPAKTQEAPKPTEPAKTQEAPKPTESAKAQEAPKPTEPAKAPETTKPAEPAKTPEASKPTDNKAEIAQLLQQGADAMRDRRKELFAEGKSQEEVDAITFNEWIKTPSGKKYSDLTGEKAVEVPKPKPAPAPAPAPKTSFQTPDEQIAAGKQRLKDLFSGKQLNDITFVTVEMAKAIGEMAIGYARKGAMNAADFVKHFHAEFPGSGIQDRDLARIFEENAPKAMDTRYRKNFKSGEGNEELAAAAQLNPEVELDAKVLALGTEYIRKGANATVAETNALIDSMPTLRDAADMVRSESNGMADEARGMLALELSKRYSDLYKKTKNKEFLNIAAELQIDTMRILNKAGQVLATVGKRLREMRETDAELEKAFARRDAARQRNERIQELGLDKELAEANAEIERLKQEIAEATVAPVTAEELVPNPKTRKEFSARSKKAISDWFDSFKVKTDVGALHDVGYLLGTTVRNGAIEAAKQAVLLGYNAAQAVKAAVDYVNKNHSGTWQQTEFERDFTAHVEKAVDNYVQTPVNIVAERVINHVSEYNAKAPNPVLQLINMLFDKAKDDLPKRSPGAKALSAQDKIVFALENYDLMREHLNEAKREVANWLETITDPDLKDEMTNKISAFYWAYTTYPWADKEIDALVKAETAGIDFKKLAFASKNGQNILKAQVADAIVAKMGLTGDAADLVMGSAKKSVSRFIDREFSKIFDAELTPSGKVKGDETAKRVIKDKLTQSIRDLALAHFTDVEANKQELVHKLIDQLDLDPSIAAHLAVTLQRNYDSIIAKKKAEIIASKTKVRGIPDRKKKRFLEQLIDASNLGAIPDEKFRDMFAEAHNIPVLSDLQWKQLDDLADKVQQLNKVLEEDKDMFDSDTNEAADAARKELLIAYRDITNIKQHAPGFADVFAQSMQLQTLGVKTMATNLEGNLVHAPFAIANYMARVIIDKITKQTVKNHIRTTSFRGAMTGAWKGVRPAMTDTWFHLVNGTTTDNINEMHRVFGAKKGWRNFMNPDLTINQRAGGLLETILAIPNKLISKGLIAGDNPMKQIAKSAAAHELAKLQGLTGKEAEKFMKYPDPVSAELIHAAGEFATFQESMGGMTDKAIMWLNKAPDELDKNLTKKFGGFLGSLAKVIAKSQTLYIRIPLNLAKRAIMFGVPELHLIRIGVDLKRGKPEAARKHLARYVTAMAVHTAAIALLRSGALTANDDEETDKERQAKTGYIQASSINISALLDPERFARMMLNAVPGREGSYEKVEALPTDTWVEYTKIPVLGPILAAKAGAFKANELTDQSMLVDWVGYNLRLGAGIMDQGIFMGTFSLFEAVKEGFRKGELGPAANQWLVGTVETLTNPLLPKTVKDISMSRDDVKRDATHGDLETRMKAMFAQRTKMFGVEAPPMKIDAWGDPVKSGVVGSSPEAYYLYDAFNTSNPDESTFKYRLAEAAVNSGNMDYLPPIPARKQTFRGLGEVELTPGQYEQFCRILGKHRKQKIHGVILRPGKMKEKYSDALKAAKNEYRRLLVSRR